LPTSSPGTNQGFAQLTIVIAKADLVSPKLRRLTVGLRDCAAYIVVGPMAFLAGRGAEHFG
jgi:hypothetical protein